MGPLPMFPLLAALPDNGPDERLDAVPDGGAPGGRRRWPRPGPSAATPPSAGRRARSAAARAACFAGVVVGILAAVAGGAVGPGRMRHVEPFAFDVLVHAITAFGIGGLFGGLAMTWWHRRLARAGEPRTAS